MPKALQDHLVQWDLADFLAHLALLDGRLKALVDPLVRKVLKVRKAPRVRKDRWDSLVRWVRWDALESMVGPYAQIRKLRNVFLTFNKQHPLLHDLVQL